MNLPVFGGGENLDPSMSGGDLSVQCCADDAEVAFHAFHNLVRIADEAAAVRWTQLGFGRTSSTSTSQQTARNLQGFKDGTNNLKAEDGAARWTSTCGSATTTSRHGCAAGATWSRDVSVCTSKPGTVPRSPTSRTRSVGRRCRERPSGVSTSTTRRSSPPETRITPAVIPANAHIRLAAPSTNAGIRILRRGYSFSDGVTVATGELDAGLFFIAYQRDPRHQFVPLQQRLAANDAAQRVHRARRERDLRRAPGSSPGRVSRRGALRIAGFTPVSRPPPGSWRQASWVS